MKRFKILTSIVLALYTTVAMSGCTAMQLEVDLEFEISVPGLGTLKGRVAINTNGEKVFRVENPTGSDVCIQPKDADGNNLGGPVEVPAGGSADLPPGTDSETSTAVKKPKKAKPAEPKPTEHLNGSNRQRGARAEPDGLVVQPLSTWPGIHHILLRGASAESPSTGSRRGADMALYMISTC